MTRHVLLLLLMIAPVSGCISRVTGERNLKKKGTFVFCLNKTTERDVIGVWGNPGRITRNEWQYREVRTLGARAKLSAYGIGATLGSTGTQIHTYTLTFDERGILRSVSESDSAPDVCRWQLWPF